MNIQDPHSKAELLSSLEDLRRSRLRFWLDMDPTKFAEPFGDAWSPADNLRHLLKSTRPVTQALRMPRPELEAQFGTASDEPAGYSDLVARYLGLLAAGGDAGKFAPSPHAPPADVRAWQLELLSKCEEAVSELSRAVEEWSDDDMDRYRLPHPLLGLLTIREMLQFTVYHFEHHRTGVAKRISAQTGPPS